MSCRRCGSDIGELLACRHCAEVASALQKKRTNERFELRAFLRILQGSQDVWVQDCTCIGGGPKVQHLAFAYWIDAISVAFCGHNIGLVRCHGNGGMIFWKPEYKDDPEICPLCLNRLLNFGGGICAGVCLLCGESDGKHHAKCTYAPLANNSDLIAQFCPSVAAGDKA